MTTPRTNIPAGLHAMTADELREALAAAQSDIAVAGAALHKLTGDLAAAQSERERLVAANEHWHTRIAQEQTLREQSEQDLAAAQEELAEVKQRADEYWRERDAARDHADHEQRRANRAEECAEAAEQNERNYRLLHGTEQSLRLDAERKAEEAARDAAMLAFIFGRFEINADSFKWRGTGNAEKLRQELIDISGVDAAIVAKGEA